MDQELARLNLNLLRAFFAVGRHCSFARATTEVGRSQATLSMQVRELERQLGVSLLVRTTRKVALTEAGAALLKRVESGFAEIADGLSTVRSISAMRQGRLVIGCVPSISGSRLPAIIASFRQYDPTLRIDVEELTSPEVVTALSEQRVDIGIAPCPSPTPSGISFAPAVAEPLCIVISRKLSAPTGEAMSLMHLATLPLITLSGSVLLQSELEQAMQSHQLQLQSRTEVRHIHTAVAMVRAEVGAAVIPRLALPDRLDRDIEALPIGSPPLTRALGILTRKGHALSSSALRFSRHTRAALIKSLAAIAP